jgi:hypothetical protein
VSTATITPISPAGSGEGPEVEDTPGFPEDAGSVLDHFRDHEAEAIERRRREWGLQDAPKYVAPLNGRGDYLEVKWRLLWLRYADPRADVLTHLVKLGSGRAVFKAIVKLSAGGSATGWGDESSDDFRDFLEKAETKAVGRALGALGFGTQFSGLEYELAPAALADTPVEGFTLPGRGSQAPTPQAAPGGAGTFVRYKDTGRDNAGAEGRKDLPLTDPQCKLIYDLLLDVGMEREDLEEWIMELYGESPRPGLGVKPSKPEHLSRAQASDLIGHLQQRRRDRKA